MFASKKIIALACAVALGAATLGGCTPEQEQAAVNGVQAACALAAAGTGVYVQVESNQGGAAAQTISKNVQTDVSIACPALASSTQAAVNAITAAGGTATVTVTTGTAKSAKRKVIAKAVITKDKVTYTVQPGPFDGILGALGL